MEIKTYILEQAKIAHEACDRETLGPFQDSSLIDSAPVFAVQSDAEVEKGLELAKAKLQKLRWASLPIAVALVAVVLAGGAFAHPALAVLLLLGAALTYGFGVTMNKESLEKLIGHGRTLEQSGRCVKMHGLVTDSPSVANYVKAVTAYRQLYFFDYVLAYGLHEHDERLKAKNEEIRKNREACLALHSGAFELASK